MPRRLELVAKDLETRRCFYMFPGERLAEWSAGDAPRLFTTFLAIDAHRYPDHDITALASRLARRRIGYLCAWGPDCARVEALFDLEFVDAGVRGGRRPHLMTTSHEGESLAEALWFAVAAVRQELTGMPALVAGADREEWRAEIAAWLGNVEALRDEI